MSRTRSLVATCVALSLAGVLAACSGSPASSPVAPSSSLAARPSNPGPNLRSPDHEFVELCKVYVGGTGPAVTFNITADIGDNGSIDDTFSTTLSGGQCQDIWVNGFAPDRIVVTEVVPTGSSPSFVISTRTGGVLATQPSVSGNVATALSGSNLGSLIVFTNTVTTPPPPAGVGGCTPGYWKQTQHFDSWTAPYTPNTLFSAVFENAFPGMTLLEVLSQGGGGLNALGRHTVAALLSSASSGVNYGMTPAQVIAAFNGVFPGGDYNTLHNTLAAANERGCPLN